MTRTNEKMARYEADKIAFAKRLNQALDDIGWPARGRAPKLKGTLRDSISIVAIRKWLLGDGMPEMKRIGELSQITGKSVQWLLTGNDAGDSSIEVSGPVYMVPLISWVSAGMLCDTGDVPSLEMAEEYIPSPVKVGSRAYAAVIRGDSMTSSSPQGKSYPDGTIGIFDPDVEPVPPCRVHAMVSGESTFKELLSDAGTWLLAPLNPRYPTRVVDETVCICAVLRVTVSKE